jgi:uncharacterized protein YfaS (alpha-2-macroglobulin family)
MPTLTTLPSAYGDYANEWRAVDSLTEKGLYKSALSQVETILKLAKNEKNGQQVVKALLHKGKFLAMLEEDGFEKAVEELENEARMAGQPEKAVLQSILGQLYQTYLRNNGFKKNNLTPTDSDTSLDPLPNGNVPPLGVSLQEASAAQLERYALALYAASVAPAALLRDIPVEQFRDVTSPGANDSLDGQALRPSLFDLLAHRALDHFANERNYLTEPAFAFELNGDAAFSPAEEFVRAKFDSRDSTSGKWLAVKLFQRILAEHLKQKGAALYDADLLRLQFAYNNSTLPDKRDKYKAALARLKAQVGRHPISPEISFRLAGLLNEQEDGDKSALAKEAVAMLEEAVRSYPGTYGAAQCNMFLQSYKAPSLNLMVEEVCPAGQAVLASIMYKNTSKVWAKAVKLAITVEDFNNLSWEEQMAHINGLKPVQSKVWSITDLGDYQEHRTEIAFEKLNFGEYWAVVANNEQFDPGQGAVSFAHFTVSNLAAVPYSQRGSSHFVVADRVSGKPLEGVKLDFFKTDYNYGRKLTLVGSASTDRNGIAKGGFPDNVSVNVRASTGSDSLWIGHAHNYRYRESVDRNVQAHFFTDRSLYRPGQTIYFKGLTFRQINTSGGKKAAPEIVSGQSLVVRLCDANGQVVKELKLKSNEYGTFNGAFTAPTGGLTGSMSIRAEGGVWGQTYFNVEEYKRPRFEVTTKPVEGAFRLGEKITVIGEARNYAGNAVDGAAVRYRVVRTARFPYWDYFRSSWKLPWYFKRPSMEIANGVAQTGQDGAFTILFEAIPDAAVPKKDQPVFDYRIYVDVTDITGETRSTETALTVGYTALQIELDLPNDLHIDSLRKVGLSARNMAGQPQAAKGECSIQRLVAPKTVFKPRLWERPDVTAIAQADFGRMFPDMAWKDEDNPEKWDREDFTRTVKFDAKEGRADLDLHEGRVQPGWYLVTLNSQDAFGEKVTLSRYVRVWDNAARFTLPTAFAEKPEFQPGETAKINFGGQSDGLHFFFAQEQDAALAKPEWVSARIQNLSIVEIPVRESDRGGIATHWFCIKNSRIYADVLYLNVPWSNKDLSISFETFRDKLAPGQKEEWRIKVSGPKKEKVAAEMVAAMYDASLDQFKEHSWSGISYPSTYARVNVNTGQSFGVAYGQTRYEMDNVPPAGVRRYPSLNWFDFPFWGGNFYGMALGRSMMRATPAGAPPGAPMELMEDRGVASKALTSVSVVMYDPENEGGFGEKKESNAPPPASIRRNLNETVFFFPELRTDAEGNVVLKFTMNEALTRWKLLTYTHTKELQQVLASKEVVTQKELMVIPNPPRFLRQGDEIEFSAKVSNLSQQKIDGTASLSLFDAATLSPVDQQFGLGNGQQRTVRFSVQPGASEAVSWLVKVPSDYTGAVTWQVLADGNSFRDGEENTVPVVPNRTLVTETLAMALRGKQSKNYSFESLKNLGDSKTAAPHRFTLEFTSNPVWFAVQSLPYLMEFPHECSEQIFSRYYANTLASSVVQKMPAIRRVYDRWKGSGAMLSNLSKNQDLKSALLEETPWVLEAQSEEQQKQQIALLFDLNRMADEQGRAISALAERQLGSGGWPWFPGGKDSWYITQYMATGFAHLEKLGAFDPNKNAMGREMLDRALGYCDRKINEQYAKLEQLAQQNKAKMDDDHLDGMVVQYLYLRSFYPVDRPSKELGYYLGQAEKYWLNKGLYQEGMLALALHRFGRKDPAAQIVASLKERATLKEELGMYWPVSWGFYWYQLPIETQALMVEVFSEVANDAKSVEELRIWLLKNKQTNRWESTKATAEAVYALLLNGDNWLDNTKAVQVSLSGKPLKVNEYEAGTGYFKQTWGGGEVKKSWGDIKLENPNSNIVWGAAYWQYFEDLDKVRAHHADKSSPLSISRQLFLEENTPTGPVLKPVADGQALKRGDRLKVRIEIKADRAMEFVHLKDMRAAGLEPVNVISAYRWQGGLGYYESTKDLATHFFVDYLPRGTFVFEYPLVVSLRGNMGNGISSIQCMYAPEFSSHSKGLRVKVD